MDSTRTGFAFAEMHPTRDDPNANEALKNAFFRLDVAQTAYPEAAEVAGPAAGPAAEAASSTDPKAAEVAGSAAEAADPKAAETEAEEDMMLSERILEAI